MIASFFVLLSFRILVASYFIFWYWIGLVDPGCAMAWGDSCTCGDDCKCVNCPQHMKKVSQAVDLVVKAMDLSTADAPAPPPGETPPSTPVEAGRN